jgi:hypothetical protein
MTGGSLGIRVRYRDHPEEFGRGILDDLAQWLLDIFRRCLQNFLRAAELAPGVSRGSSLSAQAGVLATSCAGAELLQLLRQRFGALGTGGRFL